MPTLNGSENSEVIALLFLNGTYDGKLICTMVSEINASDILVSWQCECHLRPSISSTKPFSLYVARSMGRHY